MKRAGLFINGADEGEKSKEGDFDLRKESPARKKSLAGRTLKGRNAKSTSERALLKTKDGKNLQPSTESGKSL